MEAAGMVAAGAGRRQKREIVFASGLSRCRA
jgi:hypothetical protein